MKKLNKAIPVIALSALLAGCGDKESKGADTSAETDKKPAKEQEEAEHAHDEESLGSFDIGGMNIEAAQGHGSVEAGKEGHLVIKLPYKDDGATVVRAWIGSDDRTLSSVGKGEYAPSHDDYDIHAVAPEPLPEGSTWWLEIEKPDGTTVVGSIPLLKDVKKN